jgi:hypothetical protein
MIVVGGILATASHGVTIDGMFWMMTVARGVVGFGKSNSTYSRYLHIPTSFRYSYSTNYLQAPAASIQPLQLPPRKQQTI